MADLQDTIAFFLCASASSSVSGETSNHLKGSCDEGENAWQNGKLYVNRSVLLLTSPGLNLGMRSQHIRNQECVSSVSLRKVVTELQFNSLALSICSF